MRDDLQILIIAAAATYPLTPLVRRSSIAIGALHAARSRDVHKEPAPLLGGLAMHGRPGGRLDRRGAASLISEGFPSSRTVVGRRSPAACRLTGSSTTGGAWGRRKLAGHIAAGGILSPAYLPWIRRQAARRCCSNRT